MVKFSKTLIYVVILFYVGIVCISAFNQDRTIYKWSPLWFSSYNRRAHLQKKFRDEPIPKWSPTTFRVPYFKRGGCGKENSLCSYFDDATGQLRELPCCGNLQCLPTADSYRHCSYTRSLTNFLDEDDYIY